MVTINGTLPLSLNKRIRREMNGIGEGEGKEKGRGYWRDVSAVRNSAFIVIFVLLLRDILSISFVNISVIYGRIKSTKLFKL